MDNKEFREILNLLENDAGVATTAGQINRDISKVTGDNAMSGSRTAAAFKKDAQGSDLAHQDELAIDPIMKVVNFAMTNQKAKQKLVNWLRTQMLPLMKAEMGDKEPEMASVDLSDLNPVSEEQAEVQVEEQSQEVAEQSESDVIDMDEIKRLAGL